MVTELEEGNALCRREAAWVFLNMCECGFEANESIIPEMVENGVITAVCQNLDPEADVGGWNPAYAFRLVLRLVICDSK